MRKIALKNEKEKSKRTKQLIVAGVLVFIMFFSVLGYSFRGKEKENNNKVNYNGFEFVKQNGFWVVEKGDLKFIFKYNPNEVERIEANVNYANTYYGKPLYIYSENEEAEFEIYRNFDPRLNQIIQRIQPACINEEECDENFPLKTCEDNFIIIKLGEKSEIFQNQSCVFIQGSEENLTKITDEFLFKIFKIV